MGESLAEELLRVPRLADHFEACLSQQACYSLAQEHVVLPDDDTNGR